MSPSLDSPVKHLLVDLDGTLLGNSGLHLSVDFLGRSFGVLRRFGLGRAAQALFAIQDAYNRPSPTFTNDHRIIAAFANRMKLTVEEAGVLLREGVETIFPALARHFFPIAGAKEFLDWAGQRYRLTLATNPVWPPEIVEMRVKWAGIDPAIFDFITHVRVMHACKPTEEYYREVLTLQGLKAEECLLIGNDLKMDLPATRVGIRVFIIEQKKDGDSQRPTVLRRAGALAPAWKGSFENLKALLSNLSKPR